MCQKGARKVRKEPEEEEPARRGFQSTCVALQTSILGVLSQLKADSAFTHAWAVEDSAGETAAWKGLGNSIVCPVNNGKARPDGQPLEQMVGSTGENER